MSGFICLGSGYRRVAVSEISEFNIVDGWWIAKLKEGGSVRVGQGEFAEKQVDLATQPIVAAANEEIHIFSLSERGELQHDREKVIAWVIDVYYPAPITHTGLKKYGWSSEGLICFKTPMDLYDDGVERLYKNDDEVLAELRRYREEREAERGSG